MKWYVKLALIFGGIILAIAAFILYDQLSEGKILHRELLKGTRNVEHTVKIEIQNPGKTHILRIHPSIESGWGDPDVYIKATLLDPENNVLLTVGKETLFGKKRITPTYRRSYSDYEENFIFTPSLSGKYTLKLTVLTDHVKDVYVAIIERRN